MTTESTEPENEGNLAESQTTAPTLKRIWCANCNNQIHRVNGKWFHVSTGILFCNVPAVAVPSRVSASVAPGVANLEAWTSIDVWLRDNPNATAAECLAELVKRIKIEPAPASTVVPQEQSGLMLHYFAPSEKPDCCFICERGVLGHPETPKHNTPASPAATTESPILAFESWLMRWVADNGRQLTQEEYGIAYAAFIAAHPGEGPKSHVMTASPADIRDEAETCVKCGHDAGVDALGACLFGISNSDVKTWDCPCRCEFKPTDTPPSTRAKAAAAEIYDLDRPTLDQIQSVILKRCFSTEGEDKT